MKKPVTLIINDLHIEGDNWNEIEPVIHECCEVCIELEIDNVCILGDVFHNRVAQKMNALNAVYRMFDIFNENGIFCHVGIGNHDKASYTSKESFLDVYSMHQRVKLYSNISYAFIGDIKFCFIPFFDESILEEHLKSVDSDAVIMSHFATDKSFYSEEAHGIPVESLKRFKYVFLGHIHNRMQVSKNVYHCPSLIQNNFGEDDEKGFTVVYEDLSHELVKSTFKKYETIEIDASTITQKEIDKLKIGSDVHTRVVIKGDKSKINSLNTTSLKQKGVKVNTKADEEEIEDGEYTEEVVKLDVGSTKDEFKSFCAEKNLNYEHGLKYLI